MIKPIFLFSLPRSGSTLLQRILCSRPEISSAAEPWILLPMLYALRPEGVFAEYSHRWTHFALQDFFKELPNGKLDYLEAINLAVTSLYQKASDSSAQYFLDKTPRYDVIADEVIRTFPEGKYIFLWRNPLSVLASISETWGYGRWTMFKSKIDLYDGLARMIDAYEAHDAVALALQYEKLVSNPEVELRRICEYLELKFDSSMLDRFSKVEFKGSLGDPTGRFTYVTVDSSSKEKWNQAINNPLRKYWSKRYLKWIGKRRLALMGYDLDELMRSIDQVPTKWGIRFFGDVLVAIYGLVYCSIEPFVLISKYKKLPEWKWIKRHD